MLINPQIYLIQTNQENCTQFYNWTLVLIDTKVIEMKCSRMNSSFRQFGYQFSYKIKKNSYSRRRVKQPSWGAYIIFVHFNQGEQCRRLIFLHLTIRLFQSLLRSDITVFYSRRVDKYFWKNIPSRKVQTKIKFLFYSILWYHNI